MTQEKFHSLNDFDKIINNKIVVTNFHSLKFLNSTIDFYGSNNIVFFDENVTLNNTTINIKGDNNIIFFSSSKKQYYLSIDIYNNSVIFFGENNYFNGKLNIVLSEAQNLVIGNDCLFSYGITIRTSDAHPIYDLNTYLRINEPQSVFIGDHVWICQGVSIFKGTKIGSGSIVGAMSYVSSKTILSSQIWAGNPAKKIKDGVFFLNNCIHSLDSETLKKFQSADDFKDEYNFCKQENSLSLENIDAKLKNEDDINKKLEILKNLKNNKNKDRFSI